MRRCRYLGAMPWEINATSQVEPGFELLSEMCGGLSTGEGARRIYQFWGHGS